MKQVTMESVKQRISELTYTGVQSLRGEFELSCLRELVAVTEQRDAVVAENEQMKAQAIKADSVIMSSKFEYWSDRVELSESVRLITESHATDAAISALRAEARADAFSYAADSVRNEIICLKERSPTLKEMACLANEFDSMARQLRESKGANHE